MSVSVTRLDSCLAHRVTQHVQVALLFTRREQKQDTMLS